MNGSIMYQHDDIRLAPEFTDRSTETLVLGVGDEVRVLPFQDALELAIAILDQLTGALPEEALCSSCKNPIMWLTTKNGRPSPVDPRQLRVISADGAYHTGYESHFASCPQAEKFRKKKTASPTPIRADMPL